MPETTTFEKVLEGVRAGTMVAAALAPFLIQGPEYVRQIMDAWRSLSLSDDEIKAHIRQAELEVDQFREWLDSYEPVKHPDSKL
jgi:hypothetical protein